MEVTWQVRPPTPPPTHCTACRCPSLTRRLPPPLLRAARTTRPQAFVESQLLHKQSCADAVILNRADGVPWAHSADFEPRAYPAAVMAEDGTESTVAIDERKLLVALLATGRKGAEGLRVNGQKFMVVRTQGEGSGCTVYGKKPGGGLCATATETAIVLGTYEDGKSNGVGACNIAVETLGEYLRAKGM